MKNDQPQYRPLYKMKEGKRAFVDDLNLQLSIPEVKPLDIEIENKAYSLHEIADFLEEIHFKKRVRTRTQDK